MKLEKFCQDSWIVKKGKLRESLHCDQTDLYDAIRKYQQNTISDKDSENLLKCAMCGVGKVQKVWKMLKIFLLSSVMGSYFMRSSGKRDEFFDDCFNEMVVAVLNCIKKFDLDRLEDIDNLTVMRQLSGYIAQCLHFGNIYEAKIKSDLKETDEIDEDIETDEQMELDIISRSDLEKILGNIKEKGPKINDFINESKSGMSVKSDRARKQKKRLMTYLETHRNLSPSEAKDTVNAIQKLLENGMI
jgi:hypothetical protein